MSILTFIITIFAISIFTWILLAERRAKRGEDDFRRFPFYAKKPVVESKVFMSFTHHEKVAKKQSESKKKEEGKKEYVNLSFKLRYKSKESESSQPILN